MVHFNFTVSDVDAENIFGCIQSQIVFCDKEIMLCIADNKIDSAIQAGQIAWYRHRKEYLQGLLQLMANSRVPSC